MLTLAIAAPIDLLARLQLRTLIATDALMRVPVGHWWRLRGLAAAVGIAASLGVGVLWGLGGSALLLLFLVSLAKAAEGTSEVPAGLLQRQDRLDLVGTSVLIKAGLSIGLVWYALTTGAGVVGAAGALLGAWAVSLVFVDLPLSLSCIRVEECASVRSNPPALYEVLRQALPLGMVSLLGSLRTNVPRYLVASVLGRAELAVFAALGYLMVVAGRIVTSILQAVATPMSELVVSGRTQEHGGLVRRMLGVLTGMGAMGFVVAIAAGPEIVKWLYGPDYEVGRPLLLLFVVATLAEACVLVIYLALTVFRVTSRQSVIRLASLVVTLSVAYLSVPALGLDGAAAALLAGAGLELVLAAGVARRSSRAAFPTKPTLERLRE